MKLITQRDQIRGVQKEWDAAYPRYDGQMADKIEVSEKLRALDLETVTVEELRKQIPIVVGGGWITRRCNECGGQFGDVIHLGEEPDYDACFVYLCLRCAGKIRGLIGMHGPKQDIEART